MTDRTALLATIIADPADDTRRLAFADLLDEQDEPAWAELIRVQIEIANTDMEHEPEFDPTTMVELSLVARRELRNQHRSHLCQREDTLWRDSGAMGWWDVPGSYRTTESKTTITTGEGWKFRVQRGFIMEASITLAAFMKHARELAQHPLTTIRLTDRTPIQLLPRIEHSKNWTFFRQQAPGPEAHTLPTGIYQLLEREWFATEADAHTALSRACVAYLRSLAKGSP